MVVTNEQVYTSGIECSFKNDGSQQIQVLKSLHLKQEWKPSYSAAIREWQQASSNACSRASNIVIIKVCMEREPRLLL